MSGLRVREQWPSGTRPWVIAHRGASAAAPENTMAAFECAWTAGCTWIEADVQPTLDNVPMMLHDDDLDRTTDGTGPIRARSAQEVASMDAGSWFVTGSTRPFSGTGVPTLRDLVASLSPQRSLLLEIKGDHTREQVRTTLEVVQTSGWDDRVFVQSFDVQSLQYVRSIEPDRPVGLLVHQLHDDPVAVCTELGAVAYNPDHSALRDRPELVDVLHEAGIAVLAWTADEPADWSFLTALGVDAIITNRPAELIDWLIG